MSVCEIDLDAMDSFCFVFFFSLKDELFENGIGTCHDADDDDDDSQMGKERERERERYEPDR